MKSILNKGYIYQDMGNEAVIFHTEKSDLFSFNETAAVMLKLILEGKTSENIIASLMKSYKVNRETLKNDYNELVENLKENNIIE